MNVSRAKRTLGAALALGACVAYGMGTALAQDSETLDLRPPLKLEPPKSHPAPTPARPLPRGPFSATPSYEVENAPPSRLGGGVQVEQLDAINPDVAGTLTPENGGFGPEMWAGTSRHMLDNLMAQLPVTSSSPTMRDLMRRLLLTGAQVPEGGQPGTLIAMRTTQLSAMGDFAGVNGLLERIPNQSMTGDLLRVEVDTRFLTGDVARACQLAQAHIHERESEYWQKAFIFCQAMEGETDAALLGTSLLEEMGSDDQVFFQLIQALAAKGKPPVIESLSDPSPLHLAVARVAKAKLPPDVIASNRPGVLRAIAISPNATPELRLEAAERAEVAGALDVDTLRQLYASITFDEKQLKSPLTSAEVLSPPMGRALLYRATLMQSVPAAQAEALNQALFIARQGGRYASTARAFLPQLSRVEASKDLTWFAPEAIRAFLVSGRFSDATPWFHVLKNAAAHDSELARALTALMPLARLSGFEPAANWDFEKLPDWWQAVKDGDDARAKAATLFAGLMAEGQYVPQEIWTDLIDGPSHTALMAPHASQWFSVVGAASQGRMGELVLLSMVSLGEGGPARADPIVLHHILRAMRHAGLDQEVHNMVLEAVVAAGL